VALTKDNRHGSTFFRLVQLDIAKLGLDDKPAPSLESAKKGGGGGV